MKTPKEKYQNDPQYKQLVDIMVSEIEKCNFTPSEMREASVFASIVYMQQYLGTPFIYKHKEVIDFLDGIEPSIEEYDDIEPLSTEEDDNDKRIAEMREWSKNREDEMIRYKLRKIITNPNPIEEIISDVLSAIRTGEVK